MIEIINKKRIETNGLSKYSIISAVVPDGCLAYHSALEFHGLQTQIFNHVQVASPTQFSSFTFKYEEYRHVTDLPRVDVKKHKIGKGCVFCPSISQTLVDCINHLAAAGGVEEIVNAFLMLSPGDIDYAVIKKTLNVYDKKSLWQRTGYLFELFSLETNPSLEFLRECRMRAGGVRSNIANFGKTVWNKKWNINIPVQLDNLSIKGVAYALSPR